MSYRTPKGNRRSQRQREIEEAKGSTSSQGDGTVKKIPFMARAIRIEDTKKSNNGDNNDGVSSNTGVSPSSSDSSEPNSQQDLLKQIEPFCGKGIEDGGPMDTIIEMNALDKVMAGTQRLPELIYNCFLFIYHHT